MKILFICTHNRCRSILAEAITNHIGQTEIQAVSAGSSPQGQVHPLSLQYLEQHGIDTKGLKSQSWDEFETYNPDAVITLCDSAAEEACPVWFGNSIQVHWGLADPSRHNDCLKEQERAFKNTINILEQRIQQLLVQLKNQNSQSIKSTLEAIAQNIN